MSTPKGVKIKHSDAYKTKQPDIAEVIPRRGLEVPDKVEDPGEYTEKLSIISERGPEGERSGYNLQNKGIFAALWLVAKHNNNSKWLLNGNLLLLIVNFVMVCACGVLAIYLSGLTIMNYVHDQVPRPCMYRWAEWSECSQSCWPEGNGSKPTRSRKLIDVVHHRGDYHGCPVGIDSFYDVSNCNLYRCNVKILGPFPEGKDIYKCYKDDDSGDMENCTWISRNFSGLLVPGQLVTLGDQSLIREIDPVGNTAKRKRLLLKRKRLQSVLRRRRPQY